MNLTELDILDVWNAAGDGQLRGRRGQAFWRNGNGWNISLDRERVRGATIATRVAGLARPGRDCTWMRPPDSARMA